MQLIATGESGCVYRAGPPRVVELSGTAAGYCGAFAASGIAAGGTTDVVVLAAEDRFAVFAGAVYSASPAKLTLGDPAKAVGALVDGEAVGVYATSLSVGIFLESDGEALTAAQLRALLNVEDGSTAAGATGDAFAASHAAAADPHGQYALEADLGTAAATAASDYATAAQGAKAETAYGWGNHASAGYMSAAPVSAPAGSSASGTRGQWAWSSPYFYLCVATDTWVRLVPTRTWT